VSGIQQAACHRSKQGMCVQVTQFAMSSMLQQEQELRRRGRWSSSSSSNNNNNNKLVT
jgi:hypothetical protein